MNRFPQYLRACLLVIVMMIYFGFSANASTVKNLDKADYLFELGLLKGTTNGYELTKELNRAEASVMIVRLMGEEENALTQALNHPFTDVPEWASPYIGYLYQEGVAFGISPTYYGSKDMVSAKQFMTFMLRVLGYGLLEFDWRDSIDFAYAVSAINQETYDLYKIKKSFVRDDMVYVASQLLHARLKGESKSLVTTLYEKGHVASNKGTRDKVAYYSQYKIASVPTTKDIFIDSIVAGMYKLEPTMTFDLTKISQAHQFNLPNLIEEATSVLSTLPIYSSVLNRWNYKRVGNQLTIQFQYRLTLEQLNQSRIKASAIITQLKLNNKSIYEKELAIHDYIVKYTDYDQRSSIPLTSYTIYGALIEQTAVCHGYAESFNYLAYLAGVPSKVVFGEAITNGEYVPHAWNMVNIYGETYMVDSTFNDPINGANTSAINHYYFNVTTADILKDHRYDISAYPICHATTYNYYNYMGLSVANEVELKQYIQNQINSRNPTVIARVNDPNFSTDMVKNILKELTGYKRCTYSIQDRAQVVNLKILEF